MIWWQWMVLGALLLSAEIAVDAEFYLVFVGVSALVVGLLGTTPVALPMWAQWLVFAVVAVINLTLFRSRVYHKVRGSIPERAEGVNGEIAIVDSEIPVGATGSARLRGAVWKARNVGRTPVLAGTRAVVEEADGLVLKIRAEDE
ncbi:MAG: NfeD family protein [Myxococcota bacterium]|nr:NfeD family protein [Myxococcota bacterium]